MVGAVKEMMDAMIASKAHTAPSQACCCGRKAFDAASQYYPAEAHFAQCLRRSRHRGWLGAHHFRLKLHHPAPALVQTAVTPAPDVPEDPLVRQLKDRYRALKPFRPDGRLDINDDGTLSQHRVNLPTRERIADLNALKADILACNTVEQVEQLSKLRLAVARGLAKLDLTELVVLARVLPDLQWAMNSLERLHHCSRVEQILSAHAMLTNLTYALEKHQSIKSPLVRSVWREHDAICRGRLEGVYSLYSIALQRDR